MNRITADYVYTLDTDVIGNGYVEYEDDGTILETGIAGKTDPVTEHYHGAVVPGFVNSHCHIELSHLQGKFRKGTGMAGFIDQINELRDSETLESKKEKLAFWMDKLWRDGVSAMADISNCSDSFAAKCTSPMYTRTFLEVFGTESADCDAIMASVRELQAEAASLGLDAAPTPHSCYTMSPELLTCSSGDALASGYLSYHSQESREEEDFISSGTGPLAENRKKAGMSMPAPTGGSSLSYFIDRLGAIRTGRFDEHILLVHNLCLSQEDIDKAKKVFGNVYWAICPLSNIFIHGMLPPLELMRRNGLNITLGTDSLSSNDDLDMLREMFCIQQAFPEIPLQEILVWACKNGASFLSRNELGAIAPGMKPGLVFIDNLSPDGRLTGKSTSSRII